MDCLLPGYIQCSSKSWLSNQWILFFFRKPSSCEVPGFLPCMRSDSIEFVLHRNLWEGFMIFLLLNLAFLGIWKIMCINWIDTLHSILELEHMHKCSSFLNPYLWHPHRPGDCQFLKFSFAFGLQFYKFFCAKLDNIIWKPKENLAHPSLLKAMSSWPGSRE